MPAPTPPSPDERPRTSTATQLLVAVGIVSFASGAWLAAGGIARLGTMTLIAAGAVGVGIGALLAAGLLQLLTPTAGGEESAEIVATLDAVGRGDLTREPREAGDRHRAIRAAVRRALGALRGTVDSVREHGRETATRANEFATHLGNAHLAAQRSGELAASVADRVRGSSEMVRQLEHTVAGVEARAQTLEAERRTLLTAAEGRAQDLAEVSRDLDAATEALTTLDDRFRSARDHLANLDRSVDEVREFVALVRKMSRQSKLLSLNAAMEAARAGEQGTGFAVVASEVRRLAKGSSDAADRTEALLKDLLRDTAVARESAAASVALVEQGVLVLARSRDRVRDAQSATTTAGTTVDAEASITMRAEVDRLLGELDGLVKVASDARLAQGATFTRLHDLIAAAHSLSRSAARVNAVLDGVRTGVTPPVAPAAPKATGAPLPAG